MMKLRIGVLMIIMGLILGSCGKKAKSFAEWKKEEKEAINRLIAREGFEILTKYPANGVFGEKQFVLLDNGCYLNVIDSGNGNRAISGKTTVLMRCSIIGLFPPDTFQLSIFENGFQPLEFIYGRIYEAKMRAYNEYSSSAYMFLSSGVESALEHVGENAIVRMIVPFDNGQSSKYLYGIGSAAQDSERRPLYYNRIRYVFDEY